LTFGVQLIGAIPGQNSGISSALNDNASVITGQSLDFDARVITPTIWTARLGMTDFNEFLGAQGVVTTGLGAPRDVDVGGRPHDLGYSIADRVPRLGLEDADFGGLPAPCRQSDPASNDDRQLPQGLNSALASGGRSVPAVRRPPTGIAQLLAGKPAAGRAPGLERRRYRRGTTSCAEAS
jgi:hypothetical protein